MKHYQVLVALAGLGWPSQANGIREGLGGGYVDRCPASCSGLRAESSPWPQVHKLGDLKLCGKPLLLDLNVQNLATEQTTPIGTCPRAAIILAHETACTICDERSRMRHIILFAKSKDAVVSFYAGADVYNPTLAGVIDHFNSQAQNGEFTLQVCELNSTIASTVRLVARNLEGLGRVQDTAKT